MKLDGMLKPPHLGGRFFLTGYLPTCTALLFLLVLVWAGGRAWIGSHRISFKTAWATATALGTGQALALVLVVLLLAVVSQPFQLSLVRLLEGGWPDRLGAGLARAAQARRKRRLAEAARLPQDEALLTDETVQRAGLAGDRLRRRFPLPDHLLRPTALGNALAAMEDRAGRAYGFDAVAVWPRLYPVLGEKVTALVDDRRDSLDLAARLSVTMTFTGLVSAVLLAWSGPWALLALVPLALGFISYRGAVQAALAYGESVEVAFDLHRFDLVAALRLDPPADPRAELAMNAAWSDFWRQGIPLPDSLTYAAEKDGACLFRTNSPP